MADRYLTCPACSHTEWLSLEDPDTTLSLMAGHIRWKHFDSDWQKLLANVGEVERG